MPDCSHLINSNVKQHQAAILKSNVLVWCSAKKVDKGSQKKRQAVWKEAHYFFLPAMAIALPLRVLALFLVF